MSANHLLRSACGQRRVGRPNHLASRRGSINGQAAQNRLPTSSSANTTSPR